MSYTFSRRNFMKYTVLAAAAVAVSGSLTGCSNPNQPYSDKPEGTLSFGGSSNIFGVGGSDKQTLSGATYSDLTGIFKCDFEHYAVAEGFFCGAHYYKIVVDYSDGKSVSYGAGSSGVTVTSTGDGALEPKKTYTTQVTFSGIDYTDAEKVSIYYYPKSSALGNTSDSYGDVHAGWNITSVIQGA